MKSALLLLTCLSVVYLKAEDQVCYFHYSGSDESVLNYVDADSALHLNFKINEEVNRYDGVRLKFFGTKNLNGKSERVFKTHDLSTDFLVERRINDKTYELVALNKKGNNIWYSEMGLENIRFMDYDHIRIEIHLLKEKGTIGPEDANSVTAHISYFEHLVNSSQWLSVKDIKQNTRPKKKRAVIPIVSFSVIGAFIVAALASQ